MTAKDYLSQALRLQRRIEALTDRQRRYREMGWSCGEDGRRRMLAMARELDARVAEYTEKAREIERAIDAVEDVEMNPDTEKKKNILGNNSFVHNGYEITADAEPFYAEVGDALFERLQQIVDTQATDDGCKTSALEVHLWEEGTTSGTFVAYKQECYVVPTSYGGDTSGYQIPFTVNYVGDKVKGKFTPASGDTPASFVAD